MAKLKPAGRKKKETTPQNIQALPCLLIVFLAIILVSILFYAVLSSAN